MGMDLSPTNKDVEGFHFSIWSWPPVINLIRELCPEEFSKIDYPYTNDGSYLDGESSRKVGETILKELQNPSQTFITYIENLPESPSAIQGRKVLQTSKFFDFERLEAFARFLLVCDGFEIW